MTIRRIIPAIEIFIMIILLGIFSLYLFTADKSFIQLFIISMVIYAFLTALFFVISSPAILLASPNLMLKLTKKNISTDEKSRYFNKAVLYLNYIKVSVIVLIVIIALGKNYLGDNIIYGVIISLLLFFSFLFWTLYNLIVSIYRALGYSDFTSKDVLTKFMFYYNPEDERSFIEKDDGLGTTVNFASPEGRRVMIILIAIPVIVITLIIIMLNK